MGWGEPRAARGKGNAWRRGSLSAVTALLVVAPMLGLGAAPATADAGTPPAQTEDQKALAEAQRTGQRVEIAGQATENTTTYANPDGLTFTLEDSAVPVRAKKPGGGWQTPDATLVRRPDGSVGPAAAVVDMSFSGGGDGAGLVRISEQGKSLQVGWPGRLPAPVLSGASALYPDVLPDVDLKVTATVEGFQHVLVVKTPEAARDPRLKKVDYTLSSDGLTVRTGTDGDLAAVDGEGRTVFRAPRAQMWNSAGAVRDEAPAAPAATGRAAARTGATPGDTQTDAPPPGTTAFAATPSGEGVVDRSQQPGQGDDVAEMRTTVTDHSVSVVPDADLIGRTTEAQYPLYIDPTVTWSGDERTLLRSDGYKSYNFGNGTDNEGSGIGHCGTWNGYYCGPGYTQRLYFEFSPTSLKGKSVLSATFRATETWSFSCDARWVDLERTDNISSSTAWSSKPKDLDLMVDRNVSAGRGSACSPSQPTKAIDFTDNAEETNENLTPTVKSFAAGSFSRLTLELRAHDESDTSAWKRFKNDAVLAVKFVATPALPKTPGLVTGDGVICSTNSADPTIVSDPTPLVSGRPQTAAGGESGANLRIRWRTDKWDGSTWVTAFTDVTRPTSGYVANLATQTASLPTLQEGTKYRLKALTLSFYEGGTNQLNTGYTTPCYFTVDSTAPKAPVITMGSPYTACTATSCAPAGGPGTKGTFTFAPASGDTNNVAYQYKLSTDTAWSAEIAGATVHKDIVPGKAGTYQLTVRAKDSIGRWGAQSLVDFLVAAGAGPVAQWHFDEASGVAVDSSTTVAANQHNATLSTTGATRDGRGRRGEILHDASGVPVTTPATDKGLSLDGTSGYASTAGPVLETRSAYTLSTWVRLDDLSKNQILLSQDGTRYSPFIMGYDKGLATYFFGVKEQDADTGTAYYGIKDTRAAQVGQWTHLLGTYDPATQEIKLYVNGILQGTTHTAGSWSATGAFQIGRYKWANLYQYNTQGIIDEVKVWQRTLTPDEALVEARSLDTGGFGQTELVGAWDPANASGTSLADTASGYGRSLTLTGGASLDGESLVLDGVNGAATTPGALVDDSGSFTVTTAVSLDGAKLAAKPVGYVGQVVGQRTASGSSWGFWFQLTGKSTVLDEDTLEEKTVPVGIWHFGRLNSDGTFTSVVSDETAAMDSAVRLTGVFNAQDGTVSLYLGHNQNGEEKAYTAQVGTGEFAVGASYAGTTWQHYLPGRITDVRVWAGAMVSSEQIDQQVGD